MIVILIEHLIDDAIFLLFENQNCWNNKTR
jgi:hypothetical protein